MKELVITIDGPSGAGKTTVSKMLADRLGYRYVDTGALYRGIAYEVQARGIDYENEELLAALCESIDLKVELVNGEPGLLSGGVDISGKIRTPEISMLASAVSAKPVVRSFLLVLQRRLGSEKQVVFEGRDMGTVVFPEADVKFFLDASCDVRARRRYLELQEKSDVTYEEVLRDVVQRDENDRTRAIAPLKPAEGAVMIDATDASTGDVVEQMLGHIKGI